MPNGLSHDPHYEEIIAGYEVFFSPMSELIVAFAKRHNLLLQKYYHDAPSWSLCFLYPSGGVARIDLNRKSEHIVRISGIWWVDDYDSCTRSIKETDSIECEPIVSKVEPHLIKILKSVLSFTPGDWSQVATGYEKYWHKTWTREQFDRLNSHLPYPQLD
ncbi:MAG: hypothetical protein ABSD44_05600 [Terracidiphilus sp.]